MDATYTDSHAGNAKWGDHLPRTHAECVTELNTYTHELTAACWACGGNLYLN